MLRINFRQCLGAYSYTVKPGDTLYNIAVRFGTTPADIIRVNPSMDPEKLYTGQKICIPESNSKSGYHFGF